MSHNPKKISILGVTGSIGQSTAKIIESAPDQFDVQTVTAHKNVTQLAEDAIRLKAKRAIIADTTLEKDLRRKLESTDIQVYSGMNAIIESCHENLDLIVAAIMGFAGLRPIISALGQGTSVAVANKEPLVAAGPQIMALANKTGAKILPVDSEHNAIFQVFEQDNRSSIDSIILTASGGPFLDWDLEETRNAPPEKALKHPNWSMGAKISIDSATMMNKALEIIEAHYLFDMPKDKIKVLIHPQSTIHSMVSYADGSILSQMGASDMCTPISHALSWPDRMSSPGQKLNLKTLTELTFQHPDTDRFPALTYAYKCLDIGQHACIALNAANEVAVAAYLEEKICFGAIMDCVSYAVDDLLNNIPLLSLKTVEDIEKLDNTVRDAVIEYISNITDN